MPTTDHPIACLEVWGGNTSVDAAVALPGLDLWVYAVPYEAEEAGGDVHFVSSCGSGRITRLMVADVAGHGREVAETAGKLRGLMRRFMNRIDQRHFLVELNREFERLTERGRFATAVVLTFFAPTRRLSLTNAGHPPPLLYRAGQGCWGYLVAEERDLESNIPLGIESGAGYEQFDFELKVGDLLLCYTDSLTEGRCADGSLLGVDQLAKVIAGHPDEPRTAPDQVIPQLLADLAAQGVQLKDDVTILLLRANGSASQASFVKRFVAGAKLVGMAVTRPWSMPWPEFTVRNLGGAIVPALSKIRGRGRAR